MRDARVPKRKGVPAWKKVLGRIALLALFAAALSILLFQLDQMTRHGTEELDFVAFYTAGKIVNGGHSNRLYNVHLQQNIERAIIPSGPFMPYYHPPFQALLFAPLALLSFPHAFLIWATITLAAWGLIVYLTRLTGYRLRTWPYILWTGICLFFVLIALDFGEDTLLLALVFLLAFLALKRRRNYVAGLALGLGLFRFEILLPFVFIFLLRRRWKLFAGFCTVGTVLLAVSAALVGWTGLVAYVRTLIEVGGAAAGPWADRSSASMMPCLRGAFDSLLGGVIPHNFLFPAILAATFFLLGWAARKFKDIDRPADPAFDLEFSLAVIAALLSGYHVFIGQLTPLIVVGFVILAYEAVRPRQGILGNRRGTVLLLLIFGVVAGVAAVHSQAFSVEVVVLLGVMVWLARESSRTQRPETVR